MTVIKGETMTLTPKQRAHLRGLGNALDPVMQIGKEGLSQNSYDAIDALLEARELVKIRVLKNSDLRAREICDLVCQQLDADPVQVIGSNFIIYKKSTKKDFKHIQLI